MNELLDSAWASTTPGVFDPTIGLCMLHLRKVDSNCP